LQPFTPNYRNLTMKKKLQLSFGNLEFHENYVIGIINDGILITEKETQIVSNAASHFFNKKKFVYISKRINSYSINPMIYKSLDRNNNILGFAVFSTNNSTLINAEVEKLFYKRSFGIFKNMEEAKHWATKLLKTDRLKRL